MPSLSPRPDEARSAEPHPAEPRSAEGNLRLDPLGIYGTRSARRRQQMRRRRRWQNALLWLVGGAALAGLGWWAWQPHSTSLRAGWTRALPFRPASAPWTGQGGRLLFASQSGGLWASAGETSERSAPPRRVFAAAFAPAAMPLSESDFVFWPGADGVLTAVDLASGRARWGARLPSALVARPALARAGQREIVAVADDEGHAGAFDAASGAPLWKRDLGGPVGEGVAAIEGGAPAFVFPTLAGTLARGGLVCLDAQSGALRWRFPADARAQSAGLALPAVANGRVFWGNDEGFVVALDAATGRKIWKSFAAPRPLSQGALSGGASAAPGQSLVTLRGAPVLSDGCVVVGGNDGWLRAFDAATGAPRWAHDLGGAALFPAQPLRWRGAPALLAAGAAPLLVLLDARDGRVLRSWALPFRADFGAIVAGQTALALDAEGHLQSASLQ